jgi:hypothetical protein
MKPFPYENPDDDDIEIEQLELTVYETDNPVIAVFLDVDGDPIVELHERPIVPFGYQK